MVNSLSTNQGKYEQNEISFGTLNCRQADHAIMSQRQKFARIKPWLPGIQVPSAESIASVLTERRCCGFAALCGLWPPMYPIFTRVLESYIISHTLSTRLSDFDRENMMAIIEKAVYKKVIAIWLYLKFLFSDLDLFFAFMSFIEEILSQTSAWVCLFTGQCMFKTFYIPDIIPCEKRECYGEWGLLFIVVPKLLCGGLSYCSSWTKFKTFLYDNFIVIGLGDRHEQCQFFRFKEAVQCTLSQGIIYIACRQMETHESGK
ncbi:hypothetical protein MJG53_005989 [Ovis ammon polii x Ovis aries]|uniref:Uncharacterized protein n=1 Tax=Ovis ammon polii x Ovis aries TaxID=2918886 RepID=A0ACB9V750_9CETA|nr:hypothetical protein MJG53_005989 [Ovis ammon polii x Ovis aries]